MGEGLLAADGGIDGGLVEQIQRGSLRVDDRLVLVVVVVAVAQRVVQRKVQIQVQIRYVVRCRGRAVRRHARKRGGKVRRGRGNQRNRGEGLLQEEQQLDLAGLDWRNVEKWKRSRRGRRIRGNRRGS